MARTMVGATLLLALFVGVALLAFTLLGPWLFGFEVRTINGGSMGPAMPRGSLAVVAYVEPETIKVGDVIVFRRPGDTDLIVTHRVMQVEERGVNLGFLTKGDANESRDAGKVKSEDLIGKVAAHVPLMGLLLRFLRTPLGFLAFVATPATLLAWHEVKNIISIIQKRRRDPMPQICSKASVGKGEDGL